MTYTRKRLEERIADVLQGCASSVNKSGGGGWDISLSNGKALPMTARLSNDWLLLDAPVSDRVAREDLWQLLRLNATLPGFSKFVLTPRRSVHLRADVPLPQEDESIDAQDPLDANLATRLSEACSNLKAAYGLLRGEEIGHASLPVDHDERNENRAEELRRGCAETGWPFVERAGGRTMIELDVRDSFYQAVVEQRGAGAQLWVELSCSGDLTPISRQALSVLLLTTGDQVRLARPSVDGRQALPVARFEVIFNTPPTVSDFRHALSSLSVASAICGREALAVRDEDIARQYLAIRGIAESPTNVSLSVGS